MLDLLDLLCIIHESKRFNISICKPITWYQLINRHKLYINIPYVGNFCKIMYKDVIIDLSCLQYISQKGNNGKRTNHLVYECDGSLSLWDSMNGKDANCGKIYVYCVLDSIEDEYNYIERCIINQNDIIVQILIPMRALYQIRYIIKHPLLLQVGINELALIHYGSDGSDGSPGKIPFSKWSKRTMVYQYQYGMIYVMTDVYHPSNNLFGHVVNAIA